MHLHRRCLGICGAVLISLASVPPVAAQTPGPTVIATAMATPTATPTPTPTATPTPLSPLPTANPPPRSTPDLLLELIFGKDRAATLALLGQRLGWLVLLVVAALFVLPFIWKPVGTWLQQAITNALKHWQKRRSGHVGQGEHQAQLAQLRADYLAWLQRELALTEVVRMSGAPAQPLDTLNYVPLRVTLPLQAQPPGEPLLAAFTTLPQRCGLLLSGPPGSGKSHSLRYTALVLAQHWPQLPDRIQTELGLSASTAWLPIYIRLQDLPRCQQALQADGKPPDFLAMLDYHLYQQLKDTHEAAASLLKHFVSEHFSAAQPMLLLLFDGLDEVVDLAQRREFQAELGRLQRHAPQHRYVVTSRPLADQQLTGYGFSERSLLPLQPSQMQQILAHCLAAWIHPAAADAKAAALLQTIQADRDLEPMAANPLFLTAMARMLIVAVGLPQLRVHKLQELIDLLLEWRRNRLQRAEPLVVHHPTAGVASVDHREALAELRGFAMCMLIAELEALSLDAYVLGQCCATLPPRPPSPDALTQAELERLFRSVALHTGLLSEERNAFRFSFAFRDYLAACWLAERPEAELCSYLYPQRTQAAWADVTVLAVSYAVHHTKNFSSARQLLNLLLEVPEPESWLFAAELLAEAQVTGFVKGLGYQLNNRTRERLHELAERPKYAAQAQAYLSRLPATATEGA